MPDALRLFVETRREGFLQLGGLISLALLCYMVLVFGRFLVYWAGSRHAFRHGTPAAPGDPALQWHLMVPCRDEETVIARTLAGLRAVAPAAHLWVIDDDSEDATRELVLAAADRDPRVHLVQRRRPHARIGKGAALNAAYREISAWLPPGTDRSRVVLGVRHPRAAGPAGEHPEPLRRRTGLRPDRGPDRPAGPGGRRAASGGRLNRAPDRGPLDSRIGLLHFVKASLRSRQGLELSVAPARTPIDTRTVLPHEGRRPPPQEMESWHLPDSGARAPSTRCSPAPAPSPSA
ncbi:glycosyltransferase [Kitasatospora sp. NPDC008115]|uniref:glycosyltransferase n=1 Tax=Kitasatospora sp. NPDC008115 TaxID=3364022 RepID=UPI0036E802BE